LAKNIIEHSNNTIVNEIQVLLAEKRTMLSLMQTGIAVFALPLSVLSVLIATSKYYTISHVIALLIPVLVICIGLIFLATYLVLRSMQKLRHYDRHISAIKRKYNWVADLLE
jgi:uncharacterized protein YybS (DUF2232 family)